eukprot:5053895-Amphidinium_carterae.1
MYLRRLLVQSLTTSSAGHERILRKHAIIRGKLARTCWPAESPKSTSTQCAMVVVGTKGVQTGFERKSVVCPLGNLRQENKGSDLFLWQPRYVLFDGCPGASPDREESL